MSDPDAFWRRPSDQPVAEPPPVAAARPAYTGPPPTLAPAQWAPAPVIQPPQPPRRLPPQDHQLMDAQDRLARLVSYGVGAAAGALMFVLLVVIVLRGLGS